MRALLDWLIHLLGGLTESEAERYLESERVFYRGESNSRVSEVNYLREQLELSRNDYLNLSERVHRHLNFGVVPEVNVTQDPNLRPIHTSREPWNKRKNHLEQLDRELAADIARKERENLGRSRLVSDILPKEEQSAS